MLPPVVNFDCNLNIDHFLFCYVLANMKVFQRDVYCLLANHLLFVGSHQVSVLVVWRWGLQVNKFEQISSDSHKVSLESLGLEGISCVMSKGTCTVKSNASWVIVT